MFGELDLDVPRAKVQKCIVHQIRNSLRYVSRLERKPLARDLTLVYTTDPVERLNRKIKKVAEDKAIFPNDQTLIKQASLAVEEAAKKWTFRQRDWAIIDSQLMIYFGHRLGGRA